MGEKELIKIFLFIELILPSSYFSLRILLHSVNMVDFEVIL